MNVYVGAEALGCSSAEPHKQRIALRAGPQEVQAMIWLIARSGDRTARVARTANALYHFRTFDT